MALPASDTPLHDRITQAFANPGRLAAINRAAERFYQGRDTALVSLPDPDATRDHARAIRAHTIAHLDQYLEQFEASVQAAGGQVHWARDAAEACQIVIGIARRRGARRIAKSKSMVTEEIRLNTALEGAGLEVIETDLGEYIAQIGGDHPSHIIAPVLHLTRQEVGHIFADRLTVPYTDDPIALNNIARERLRQVYLTADIGISGCNFAVAETGTICLVTNEGNGRMVTTLPPVTIAVMGMERVVPTIDDLSVLLQVLARSATGQKLSVYTSLVTGSRRAGEPHGPEEMHVVIVDNGRSRALAGDLAEILYCIRCGACLNICPVYRAIGGHAYGSVYPGPVGSVVSPILGGIPAFGELPHASTLCGACRDACPVRIDLPTLLLRLRRDTVQAGQSPGWLGMGMKAFAAGASRSGRFRAAQWLAGLFSRITGGTWYTGRLPGPAGAWTRFRHFPPFARRTFQQEWEEQHGD
jgi:L-lactate dehydrogenase complex protein LldF